MFCQITKKTSNFEPEKSFKCKQNIADHSKQNGCQIVTRKSASRTEHPCIKGCRFSIQSYRNFLYY